MLVLTRCTGEAIVLDGKIRVRVLAVQGSKVRLGIEAPDWMLVDREEVHAARGDSAVCEAPGAPAAGS
jgi:carbon storage regulator